uniref:LIM zinc-binding domain-containing protein n=1 Tax=Onchocerca volvulus TaxID=6282 RepID=A0A8R1XW03_ONCVO
MALLAFDFEQNIISYKIELDENARCLKDKFYFQQCCDYQCMICAACRHPIDNGRSVFALGKYWHVDHFLCTKCEKPFYGSKSFEKKDRAYCYNCCSKTKGDRMEHATNLQKML